MATVLLLPAPLFLMIHQDRLITNLGDNQNTAYTTVDLSQAFLLTLVQLQVSLAARELLEQDFPELHELTSIQVKSSLIKQGLIAKVSFQYTGPSSSLLVGYRTHLFICTLALLDLVNLYCFIETIH